MIFLATDSPAPTPYADDRPPRAFVFSPEIGPRECRHNKARIPANYRGSTSAAARRRLTLERAAFAPPGRNWLDRSAHLAKLRRVSGL